LILPADASGRFLIRIDYEPGDAIYEPGDAVFKQGDKLF